MADDIQITISGNDAKLIAVWQRQQAEILKNQKALMDLGQAGERTGAKIGGAFEGAIGQAKQLFQGIVGVGSAVGGILVAAKLLKAEWEDLVRRQEEAGRRQRTTAQAERKMLINLGVNPPEGLDQATVRKQVAEIALRNGALQKDVFETMSSALSARGNLTPKQMFEAVDLAVRVAPGDAGAQQTMSGAIMDLTKKNKGSTPQQNFGMMLAMQGASRVKALDQLATNAVPAVVAQQGIGSTAEEAAELTAAFTQALADPEGAISKTASTQFTKQIFDATSDKFGADVTFNKRLEYIQSAEGAKVRKRLLGDPRKRAKGQHTPGELVGEVQALPAMRGFLTAGSVESGLLKEAQRAIPGAEAAGKDVPKFFERLNATPLQEAANFERDIESEADDAYLKDFAGGDTFRARTAVEELMKSRGYSLLDRKMAGTRFEVATLFGAEPRAEAATIFRDAAEMKRNPGMFGTPDEKGAKEMDRLAQKMDDLGKIMARLADRPLRIEADVPVQVKNGPGVANDRRAPGP